MSRFRLVVDPVRCDAYGLCAEILPELVQADDWGYPVIATEEVPTSLEGHARRAVSSCPKLALHLVEVDDRARVPASGPARPGSGRR